MDIHEPRPVNFGSLPPLPAEYVVKWHPNLEMYMGHGPDEYETPICWNRFWVRRWLFDHAEHRAEVIKAALEADAGENADG